MGISSTLPNSLSFSFFKAVKYSEHGSFRKGVSSIVIDPLLQSPETIPDKLDCSSRTVKRSAYLELDREIEMGDFFIEQLATAEMNI